MAFIYVYVPMTPADQLAYNKQIWGYTDWPKYVVYGDFPTTGAYPGRRGETANVGFHSISTSNSYHLFCDGYALQKVVGD